MTNLEQRAKAFAMEAHKSQRRKYVFEPYIIHPAEVVHILKSVPHTEEMLAAGWLHDVVEDCGVDVHEILEQFGHTVQNYVYWLTDISKPSDGNRKTRKHLDLLHIQDATPEAKTVKLADLISNTASIVKHDPEFAKVYLQEKLELLEVLREGDPILWDRAYSIACQGRELIAQ